MSETLGIDLGTNSIGLTLREDDNFKWYGVYTFRKGVGEGKTGEFSLAAERTKNRSSRRLYNARRYRRWETLKVLIENDYCPLSIGQLNQWKHYKKGVGRVFPVDDHAFQQWIKLDFNGDGKPDFTSPYQIRRLLIQQPFDLSDAENRYLIGRAFYHIAQRRGFKSSRKVGTNEKTAVYKGSNETGTLGRNEYEKLIEEHGSLGGAFAHLEDERIRIRNRYTLRADYLEEVKKIVEIQNLDSEFGQRIIKAIFYQRPLRSQKGMVGKCTLEPNKPRCSISHPDFEEYRAWSFINNIRYKTEKEEKFQFLPLSLRQQLIEEKFLIKSTRTTFGTIRNFICRGERRDWELNYSERMDQMSVSTCPVSAYFKAAFGDRWKNINIDSEKNRLDKTGRSSTVSYSIEDIWHLVFSFEDEEYFKEFIVKQLKLEEDQVDQLMKLWNNLPVGYANLSLKAIRNILPLLREGIMYTEAVFLAKIPEIIGSELFNENKDFILNELHTTIKRNRRQKDIVNITNSLIADYNILPFEQKFGYKDKDYIIDDSDKNDIIQTSIRYFGEEKWINKDEERRNEILNGVESLYQEFFSTSKRDYITQPKLIDELQDYLIGNFSISEEDVEGLYHPSMVDIYPSIEDQVFLISPKTRAFKNPMAYKTLHKLRHVINHLIEIQMIDSDTRIVVEVARDLNNKNKRAAIEDYQRNRERENVEYLKEILELLNYSENAGNSIVSGEDIRKYRLWKEQNCVCFYTGKTIPISDLFKNNIIDFEHTIPRSKSFDNSMANMTVCYAAYNRNIKGNRIPTELPNYDQESHGYSAINPRLSDWEDKIDSLYTQIQTQVRNSRNAMDKESRDNAIRRRHLLQMEYDYWKNKVDRFKRKDIPSGFRNSQLIDTHIISKYAYHYLRTIFSRVETIRGSVTAEFRKIYGIQPKGHKKDRSMHFHHAIDAAVLTLLPSSAMRKEILEKAYKYEEHNSGKQYHELPFPGFNYSMISEIEKRVLINNMKDQDRTLAPVRKRVRKRGKVVYSRDDQGKIIRDSDGKKIPMIAQGDAVRGQLHKETFYGKIKIAATDDNGSILRNEDQSIRYLKDSEGKDVFKMVGRKPIENVNFNTDIIVDQHLAKYLKSQVDLGVKQNELKDFQGKVIRRLRCVVKSGRGVMNPEKATKVKQQTYKSSKEYKNFYYTDSGDNYMFGLYENENGRKVVAINILDSTRYAEAQNEDTRREIFGAIEPVMIGRGRNKEEGVLIHIFQPGQKVLFFLEHRDELKDLEVEEISKRLYFVKTLFDANAQRIQFQHHLEARSDKQLSDDFPRSEFGTKGKDGFSSFSTDFKTPRLLLTPSNYNFIIEGNDFEMLLDGSIEFKY